MSDSKKLDNRPRQNLRFPAEVWLAVDQARARRAGFVSRNSWIEEAVNEKLEREGWAAEVIRELREQHV